MSPLREDAAHIGMPPIIYGWLFSFICTGLLWADVGFEGWALLIIAMMFAGPFIGTSIATKRVLDFVENAHRHRLRRPRDS